MLLALCLSGHIHAQEKKIKGLTAPLFQYKIEGQQASQALKLDVENSSSTKSDSIPAAVISNGRITGPIKYKAKDFVKISQLENKIALNNEAEILYEDTELTAGIIDIDYLTSEVQAGRLTNADGEKEQTPNFTQGPSVVIPDSIRFNFNTQKALIYNSRTEQGASLGALGGGESMKVFTEFTKKENDSVFFFKDGKHFKHNELQNGSFNHHPNYFTNNESHKYLNDGFSFVIRGIQDISPFFKKLSKQIFLQTQCSPGFSLINLLEGKAKSLILIDNISLF